MRRCQILILAVGVAALWGCGADTLTAPQKTPPKSAAKDCSTQIFYDPENCSDFGEGGGTTYTNYNGYGSASLDITFSGTLPEGGAPGTPSFCPALYGAFVPARLTPVDQPHFTVISSGNFIPQTPQTVRGRATYNWPTGWWPATDGSGREANISTAEAVCALVQTSTTTWTIRVTFFYFVGQIRQPASGGGGSGGGGSAPGGASCHMEFITVEVDNGSGWTHFWSGMASVCS